MIKIGEYVTAKLAGKNQTRQGVFIEDIGDGYIVIFGIGARYVCKKKNATTVPYEHILLPSIRIHVKTVRKLLNLPLTY